jgi:AraC-like DNA-binding protein
MKETTMTVYATRSILQFAAHYGANVEEICATTGLDPAMLQMPDQWISGALHLAVWREAVKQTGNQNIGLHLGESFNLGTFGIPGYVLLNCPTLGDVLEKIARYTRLFCQIAQIRISVSNGMVFFECGCGAVRNLVCCPCRELRYLVECTFASLLTTTQALTGKPLRLSAAWFQYAAPASTAEYDRIFQTGLRFSMPVNRLVFDANCLNWPILSSNSNLLPVFEQQAEAMLSEINQSQSYTQKVAQVIVQQLNGELPTIDAIASQLTISTRQLQRELQAEGTSFQKLLDKTRQELALHHLRDPTIPIHDIAFLTGFSGASAFNRAFKRWTGKTPRHYRFRPEIETIPGSTNM